MACSMSGARPPGAAEARGGNAATDSTSEIASLELITYTCRQQVHPFTTGGGRGLVGGAPCACN